MALQNTIDTTLQSLHLKSIQELINGDSFNIESLSKLSDRHPLIIFQQLQKLHTAITSKRLFQTADHSIPLNALFKDWRAKEDSSKIKEQISFGIEEGDVVEIIGRVNSGKTYLLNKIIIEYIKHQKQIVYLCSNNSFQSLTYAITTDKQLSKFEKPRLTHFQFKTIQELAIYLHSLGQFIAVHKSSKPWIFIDHLPKNQQYQFDNSPSVGSLQFKTAQKLKKLFHSLRPYVSAIVFTNKQMTSNGLFDTIYKHDKHRPKVTGSSSKQWDNLANKTLAIDFTYTKDNQLNWWINQPKSMDCTLRKFTKFI